MQAALPTTPWYSSIDINTITAGLTALGVVTALLAVAWQLKHDRFIKSIEVLLEFERRFETDMLATRRRVAERLLQNPPTESAEDVINFYEMVGLLLRRGALDPQMTWHAFGTLCIVYMDSANLEITAEVRRDSSAWSEARYLHAQMIRLENSASAAGVAGIRQLRQQQLQGESEIVTA